MGYTGKTNNQQKKPSSVKTKKINKKTIGMAPNMGIQMI